MVALNMIKGALALAVGVFFTAAAAAQDTLPINIGASPASDHAAAFAGVERGIFAKHGLDAKVTLYASGVEMVNGLLSGANDVNVMASVPFLVGVSREQPLVLIGHNQGDPLGTSYQEYASIVGLTDKGLAEGNIGALKGKRIGLPRGTSAESYVLGVLSENNVPLSEVELVNIAPGNIVTALRQGDVDAVSIWEPMGSTAAMRIPGAVRIISGGCESCYDPGTLLTTQQNIDGKAETLRRFMMAYAEAHQWVRQNFDEAAEINTRWIKGVDLDVMKTAVRRAKYDLRMTANTLKGYKEKMIPTLVADGRLKEAIDPTPAINFTFSNEVMKEGAEYFSDLPAIPSDIVVK